MSSAPTDAWSAAIWACFACWISAARAALAMFATRRPTTIAVIVADTAVCRLRKAHLLLGRTRSPGGGPTCLRALAVRIHGPTVGSVRGSENAQQAGIQHPRLACAPLPRVREDDLGPGRAQRIQE